MAITTNHFMTAMLIMIMAYLDFTDAQIGVYYGRNGDNLPAPSKVVDLYKRYNIQRMRIYEPYQPTLEALRGSNIELTMSVPNGEVLEKVAGSQDYANRWVQNYVRNYPNVRFKHIVIGNEISPRANSQYMRFVLPAMKNVYNAISAAGLANRIKVTTSIDTKGVENSYPPANGVFGSDVAAYLKPIVQFLVDKGAPLFVSIYPYFAYVKNSGQINLQYALLQPNSGVVAGGVRYDNLYYALVDAVYAALEKLIAGSASLNANGDPVFPPEVKGGESGWPSGGGGPGVNSGRWPSKDEAPNVANVENARIYNTNLIRIVKKGTPKRPNQPIETYIFTMFDENLKQPPGIEQHFGVFLADGRPKYPLNFN